MDDSKTGDTDTGRGSAGRARRLMAEVLTIVVGILLALSADQWVERRTERGSQPATVGDFRLATYDDLLNTGNLRLLGGLDLRSRIVDYFGNSREVAARVLDHVAGDPYQAVHLELFAAMPDGILQVTRRGHLDDWDPAPLLDAADRLPDMRTAQRIRWHNAHNEMRALVGHAEVNARLLEVVRMALSG